MKLSIFKSKGSFNRHITFKFRIYPHNKLSHLQTWLWYPVGNEVYIEMKYKSKHTKWALPRNTHICSEFPEWELFNVKYMNTF